jgi:hypothetical protein
MLLLSILVVSIVVLLVFSLSKDTGKNTKYARRSANAIASETGICHIDTSNAIEIN